MARIGPHGRPLFYALGALLEVDEVVLEEGLLLGDLLRVGVSVTAITILVNISVNIFKVKLDYLVTRSVWNVLLLFVRHTYIWASGLAKENRVDDNEKNRREFK